MASGNAPYICCGIGFVRVARLEMASVNRFANTDMARCGHERRRLPCCGMPAILRAMSATPAAVASPWSAVDFMVDFHTRDKKLGLLTETLTWIAAIALFRKAETQTHYLAEPTDDDRRQHKTNLAALIAEGERLLGRIQASGGIPENLDGVKTADVDAMVEELRLTQLQWYGDMTAQRREQILSELFDVPGR